MRNIVCRLPFHHAVWLGGARGRERSWWMVGWWASTVGDGALGGLHVDIENAKLLIDL